MSRVAERKGRVLCVTSNFPRWEGDSTTPFVLNLAQDLTELGWEVDILAPHAKGARPKEVLAGLSVERFRYAFPASAQTVCYQGGAMVNLRKRPLEKLKLPMLVAAEWAAVQWRLLTRRYDLVHSHWVLPQGFVGMLATTLARKPHVITLHGGDVFSLTSPLMTRLKRMALTRASRVTVNSSYTEAAVRQIVPDRQDIDRIPMGVLEAPLSPEAQELAQEVRARHRRPPGPLIVFVGRLVEEKGAADAVRALSLLTALPGAHLLILGEGPEKEALGTLAAELGVAASVTLHGWVQPHEVRSYLAAADVFVGPSRTAPDGWVEAQGLTFLEAMTAGTPVVASRSGGIVDSVHHEQSGLLVDEGAPEQIADAVLRLVSEPALRERLVAGGKARVLEEFSRGRSAERFNRLFSSAIRGS